MKKLVILSFSIFLLSINANSLENKKMKNFYDLIVSDLTGKKVGLEKFRGKKIMLVNVASKCGYTTQYKGLQSLYENYSKEIEIIGIPCNDFGKQEPGSSSEIEKFCSINYGISFTMLEKQSSKGKNKSNLFEWLSDPKLNGWNSELPSWNFCKYIINENGDLTHFFQSNVTPNSSRVKQALGVID